MKQKDVLSAKLAEIQPANRDLVKIELMTKTKGKIYLDLQVGYLIEL